jgi:two-component system cell cycle response regulator CpdR
MGSEFAVLFVDDDDLVRAPVAELLRLCGLRVLAASGAAEALAILEREHVDALFTDVVMPDMDGIELAKRAQALRPGIRVLFATAYYSRAADASRMGKVLFKPVRAHQLEDAVDDLLTGVSAGSARPRDRGPLERG